MDSVEIQNILYTGNQQQLEMMARKILTRNRSHKYMRELSQHADEFQDMLLRIECKDKDYLALVYILAEHLIEIKSGACACSIIEKPMYNSPERLGGILEILSEAFVAEDYSVRTHSRCLACRKEYESRMFESGFGQKIIWRAYQSKNSD